MNNEANKNMCVPAVVLKKLIPKPAIHNPEAIMNIVVCCFGLIQDTSVFFTVIHCVQRSIAT